MELRMTLPTWCYMGACPAVLQAAKAQVPEGWVQDRMPACLLGLCTLTAQAGFREAPFGREGDVYLILS